jgi:SAM-dependent methyltransferase
MKDTGIDSGRLEAILNYLIEHSEGHRKEDEKWLRSVEKFGDEEITRKIRKVVELTDAITRKLREARAALHGHQEQTDTRETHRRGHDEAPAHEVPHRHIQFHQIGTIYTPYEPGTPSSEMNRSDTQCSIIINEKYHEGLWKLDSFSHIIVLYYLDRANEEPALTVSPPWAEGVKIPWDEPGFSRRMLNVHLSQEHDAASRRFETIDSHVRWIHGHVLSGHPTRILDLGCGPGLYTSRLARLGHRCVGIDFSPASIAYAREQAEEEGLECTYIQQDIRTSDYGDSYGLVMSIFGEFNVFRSGEARGILEKAHRALASKGLLLLEPHTFEAVVKLGGQPSSWYSAERGLFSDEPHLCLQESFWDGEGNVAIERYYIVDVVTGAVTRHSASTQAYTDDQYRSLLVECRFGEAAFYPSMGGSPGHAESDLTVILSQKKPPA